MKTPETGSTSPRGQRQPPRGTPPDAKHESFHRDLVESRRTDEHDFRTGTDDLPNVPDNGLLLDPAYDEEDRFGEDYAADERTAEGQAGMLDDDLVDLGAPPEEGLGDTDFVGGGRHPRGYDSHLEYEANFGQQLGEGTWRSEDDMGEDRSGRAGFLRSDLEHVPDPLDFDEESLNRIDDGRMGDAGSGLSNSSTWEPPAEGKRSPRRHRGSDATDEFIRGKVHDEYSDHATLDASNVEVGVVDGEVTLRGTVPDGRHRELAEELALRVHGVRHVHNHLKLTG